MLPPPSQLPSLRQLTISTLEGHSAFMEVVTPMVLSGQLPSLTEQPEGEAAFLFSVVNMLPHVTTFCCHPPDSRHHASQDRWGLLANVLLTFCF